MMLINFASWTAGQLAVLPKNALLENHRGDQSPPNLFFKQVFFVPPVWTKKLGIAVTKLL